MVTIWPIEGEYWYTYNQVIRNTYARIEVGIFIWVLVYTIGWHLKKMLRLSAFNLVFLVVLYHLGIGDFNSGILGVDIFFVISGFLVGVLYDENKKLEFLKEGHIEYYQLIL